MEKRMAGTKRAVLAAVVLCVIFAVFAGAYFTFMPQEVAGSKNITVEIVMDGVIAKTIEIKTDAEFLRQALEEKNLIQGDESEFGLFIKTVDGVTADGSKQEWWCVTQNGESVMTGVDVTPILDGERYEITLTAGY